MSGQYIYKKHIGLALIDASPMFCTMCYKFSIRLKVVAIADKKIQ